MKKLHFLFSFIFTFILVTFSALSFVTNTAYAKACTPTGHECTGQTYCKDTKNGGDCTATPGSFQTPTCACAVKQTTGSCYNDDQCTSNYCTNKNGGGECSNSGSVLAPSYNCVCGIKQTKGSCYANGNQCGNGTYCADNSSKTGGDCPQYTGLGGSQPSCSCKQKQANNSTCYNSDQCSSGLCAVSTKNDNSPCPPYTGFGTQTSCVCKAKKATGGCYTDAQCTSGTYCADNSSKTGSQCPPYTGFGTQATCSCKPKLTNGTCSQDSQCQSGYYCGASGGGDCPPYTGFGTPVACSCVKNGTTLGPPTPLPGPPSPPCEHWQNGECTQFKTALGDFATNPAGFVKALFGILLSVSGGIALLLIIRAGYQLMTSQGKPEQLQQGRDQLIAAIVGLVFLIFAFVFLQLIGYDILRINVFGP